jgi:peptidyl-prolyl cis-trans isomerase SurA
MIIFEELVYQEAVRRKLDGLRRETESRRSRVSQTVQQSRPVSAILASGDAWFRQQLRQQMRRSMLIEQVLKTDVELRDPVSPAEVQAYYDKNAARFSHPESFSIQSISIVPPLKPTPEQAKNCQQEGGGCSAQAKATKSYQDFGLLAEKVSEDDFRVNMGDHKAVGRDKLPPQIVKALLAMQAGTGERS